MRAFAGTVILVLLILLLASCGGATGKGTGLTGCDVVKPVSTETVGGQVVVTYENGVKAVAPSPGPSGDIYSCPSLKYSK
ncbi:MAG: hypothetical protein ACXVQY_05295 [Actinomycetota bacterium]